MTLSDLKNRYDGQTVTICGTGPSLDNLTEIQGPRIYLNRAAFVLPISPGETYWLVIDDGWRKGVPGPWDETRDAIHAGNGMIGVFRDPLLGPGGFTPAPAGPNVATFVTPKNRDELLKMDRDAVAQRGLYLFSGTAASAIHLAWLMGAGKIRLAGIDGTSGHAKRLEAFYEPIPQGQKPKSYSSAHRSVATVVAALGVEIETL